MDIYLEIVIIELDLFLLLLASLTCNRIVTVRYRVSYRVGVRIRVKCLSGS